MIHRIPDRHFFTVKNRLEEAVKRNVENLARHKQTHTHVHTRIRTYYIPKKKKKKREREKGIEEEMVAGILFNYSAEFGVLHSLNVN